MNTGAIRPAAQAGGGALLGTGGPVTLHVRGVSTGRWDACAVNLHCWLLPDQRVTPRRALSTRSSRLQGTEGLEQTGVHQEMCSKEDKICALSMKAGVQGLQWQPLRAGCGLQEGTGPTYGQSGSHSAAGLEWETKPQPDRKGCQKPHYGLWDLSAWMKVPELCSARQSAEAVL